MRKLLNVYVARHGETQWNTEMRSQGRLDSALTEKGIKDALSLGDRLKDIDFDRILSSPSGRTVKTAELVKGNRAIQLETDERLMEIDLGVWQGLTQKEIEERDPEAFYAYWNDPSSFRGAKGETFLDVLHRVDEFFADLQKSLSSGNVLVVTHGVVIKALYLLCRKWNIDQIWAPPFIHGTSLTIVRIEEGKMELQLEGCTKHCKES